MAVPRLERGDSLGAPFAGPSAWCSLLVSRLGFSWLVCVIVGLCFRTPVSLTVLSVPSR